MINSKQKVNQEQKANQEQKVQCICVPSGCCHSFSLLGCPHKHYFDEHGTWKCQLPKKLK